MLVVCMTCAIAQDLDSLHRSFMTKYDQINGNRDAKVEALTEGYLAALDRLKKQLQTTGQLDLVLQAQNEIEEIGKDVWPPEKLGEKATNELKTLRAKYVEAREKAHKDHATQLSEVVDKMDKLLATQIIDLTKAGKIEEAKLAQKMKEDLAKDAAIAEAKSLLKLESTTTSGEWVKLWETKEKWITKEPRAWEDFKENFPLPDLGVKNLERKEVIFAHASSTFSYQIPNVSQIRTMIALIAPGDVTFSITADGKKVFTKALRGKSSKPEMIEITFAMSKTIDFITESNGDINSDQAIWIRPEAK